MSKGTTENLRRGNPGPWPGAGRPSATMVRNRNQVLQALAEMPVAPGESQTLFEAVCEQVAALVKSGDGVMVKHILDQWIGSPRSKIEVFLSNEQFLRHVAVTTARFFEEKGLSDEDLDEWMERLQSTLRSEETGVIPGWALPVVQDDNEPGTF